MEYRIFADDVEGFPLQIMTSTSLNELQDSYPSTMETLKKGELKLPPWAS